MYIGTNNANPGAPGLVFHSLIGFFYSFPVRAVRVVRGYRLLQRPVFGGAEYSRPFLRYEESSGGRAGIQRSFEAGPKPCTWWPKSARLRNGRNALEMRGLRGGFAPRNLALYLGKKCKDVQGSRRVSSGLPLDCRAGAARGPGSSSGGKLIVTWSCAR